MTVDCHAHLYHPRWYPPRFTRYLAEDYLSRKRRAGGEVASAQRTIERMLGDDTGQATLRIMDKVGIDRRVIAILDWGLAMDEPALSIRRIHEEILKVCAGARDRLVGLAGLDPRRPEALDVLRLALDELGARGLKLHPTSEWSLEDDRTLRLVEETGRRGLPVLVHVGRTMSILSDRNAQPSCLLRLARTFPTTAFIAGHSGFEQWTEFADSTAQLPKNLYADVSGWQEMLGRDAPALRTAIETLCRAMPGRVCFGSDSPFFTFNLVPTEIAWLRLVRECTPREQLDSMLANPVFPERS